MANKVGNRFQNESVGTLKVPVDRPSFDPGNPRPASLVKSSGEPKAYQFGIALKTNK